MSRQPGRKPSGRSEGRGSDKNKTSFSKPGQRAGSRGKSEARFGKRDGGFEKPFGEKKFGSAKGKTSRQEKSLGDKKPSGKFDKPLGAKGKFGKDRPKSTYKDFEARAGNRKPKTQDFDDRPRKAFGRERDFDFLDEKPLPKRRGADKGESGPSSGKPSKREQAKSSKSDASLAGIRLNKFIANSGMCSRREADVMIQNGVVTVNGKVMDELGYRVQPGDEVKFDGRTITPEKPVYILLNKPKDYITTAEDPQGRKTVMALIEGACKERVFPVGRLDRNTTGLLLFTNDGEMADKLTHPRKRVKKIYMVELDKNIKADHLKALREGITLEDGPIKPDAVEYAEGPKLDKKVLGVEIHSGRNRIVRRMFEHFGYKVVKLDRVYLAGLTKKNLPRGKYRMLEPIEVNMLKML